MKVQYRLRKRSLFLMAVLLLAAISACSVGKTEDILTSLGREGVTVNALVIDPLTTSILYAGTYFGVFKSTDGGEHWKQVSKGLTDTEIQTLAIDPKTPAILYAGSTNGYVFKSSDAAGSWSKSSTGLATNYVNVLAIDPITPTTLYAGTSHIQNGPLYKSTDAGKTWRLAASGLENSSVFSLAIDPQTPTTLYAGTDYAVVKSMDSGATWTRINTGYGVAIVALALDPETPTTVYAGGRGGRIFGSTDGGVTWSASSKNHYIYALVISPKRLPILYAGTNQGFGGVIKSSDGGANWTPANTGLPDADVFALAIDPVTPSTLYAGTHYSGVFKSMDGGAQWSSASTGLTVSLSTP